MLAGPHHLNGVEDARERTAVIVEDDPDVRDLLDAVLSQAGFATRTAASGREGVELVRTFDPLVTTLDVGLPDIDGFEVCRRIRAVSDTYVVMLTARTDEIDALMGLDAGADDYQTKPFRPRELRARIEAMLRRPRRQVPAVGAAAVPAVSDGLVVDVAARTVAVDSVEVHLTRSEFDLLAALVAAPGRAISKDALVRVLWEDEYDTGTPITDQDRRSVEAHLANLRRKLGEDVASPRWISTVRGVGYRFDQLS
ncbi:response regulator transcription factor [Krasilnikoviella flava]|uniref:DNA-binding response regulator, OmpR family, contains REC and winged-helix (WHTH) domain n=1 Tax=Krasilnikoviella flava TaxID=526729 RepID=A0A1T5K8C4_9MICO|nr:response regulator transcription factor [Krasilnikoviella flava]SKC59967.1 DNA-binding response regulator, OmpR family, contains REC and winged-helix (wHTH) domain [Krasilnikoviella flava]